MEEGLGHLLELLSNDPFELVSRDDPPFHQDRPQPPVVGFIALLAQCLVEISSGNQTALHQQVAERHARGAVRGMHQLAVLEEENPGLAVTVEGQLARLPEERDHVEQLGQAEILEEADESHQRFL